MNLILKFKKSFKTINIWNTLENKMKLITELYSESEKYLRKFMKTEKYSKINLISEDLLSMS